MNNTVVYTHTRFDDMTKDEACNIYPENPNKSNIYILSYTL